MLDRLDETFRGELRRFGARDDMQAIVDRWPAAVGDAISRNAWPARIARDGTLHVNTADSIWAFELAQRGTAIARRLEVAAVRFSPGPLASASEQASAPRALRPTPAQLREAAELVAPVGSENLRKSIEKAVGLSLARAAEDRAI